MIARTPLLLASLTLGICAAHARAQDFGGQVVQDPRANTATYDFHFDGPPRGFAFLFASPWTISPWRLPGIGNYYLSPLPTLQIGAVQMDAFGKSGLQLVLPMSIAKRGIAFQPLFVDTRLQLRLVHSICFDVGLDQAQPTFTGRWHSGTGEYCFQIGNVRANDVVSVKVGTQEVFAGKADKDGPFRGCFRHPKPFDRGVTLEVRVNDRRIKRR